MVAMLTLFAEGGFPMWFLLAFGLATLAFAARFAHTPARRTLRTAFALAGATAFTSVTGVCADLAAVGHHAPGYLEVHPGTTMVEALLQGVAESMSPAIVGFTMLSLAALVAALGLQREVTE
jgi:hypothetical protein